MYNPNQVLAEYAGLLEDLDPERKPVWGGMTAQHMVEHLTSALLMSSATISVKQYSDDSKIPALRAYLMSSKPLPRNFKNPAMPGELPPLRHKTMGKALQALKKALDGFYKYHKNNPGSRPVNPTFGPLSYTEWIQFHQKHFRHHLEQFGLIDN
jgi:hypothetical protein